MSWDTVPWFVGGGAEHSPEVARLMAYVAFRGNEGVLGAADLKVSALAVPGGAVRVAPGACSILNRATGGAYQAYAGRLPSEESGVTISPTSAGAGRSDLIIARIEDPFMPGEPWADPVDPKIGAYVYTRVVPNVPTTTTSVAQINLGYSAIALARVDLPASTGTITDTMIVDLRRIANPRRESDRFVFFPGSDNNIPTTTNVIWPAVSTAQVRVPEWATNVRILATFQGIEHIPGTGATVAGTRTMFAGSPSGQNGILLETASTRGYYSVAGDHPITPAQRGTVQTIATTAQRSGGTGTFQADYQSIITLEFEFFERAS